MTCQANTQNPLRPALGDGDDDQGDEESEPVARSTSGTRSGMPAFRAAEVRDASYFGQAVGAGADGLVRCW
jgi:hypothetical protein